MFTSDDLNDKVSLQENVTDIIHFAIAQTAWNHHIDSDSFYIRFDDSSSDSQYANGTLQRFLFIEATLCTFQSADLQPLVLIIENEGHDIGDILADKVTAMYLNGYASHSMEVSVYIPTQEPTRNPAESIVNGTSGNASLSPADNAEVSNDGVAGIIAVVAISVIVTAIVFLSILIYCLLRQRKSSKEKAEQSSPPSVQIVKVDSGTEYMNEEEGVQQTGEGLSGNEPGNESNDSDDGYVNEYDNTTTSGVN